MQMMKHDDIATRHSTMVQIEKRDSAICELYIIVITLACVNLYDLCYTIILFKASKKKSCEVGNSDEVWAITTCVSRFIAYIIWVYPIVLYFWPGSKACLCCGRKSEEQQRKESMVD